MTLAINIDREKEEREGKERVTQIKRTSTIICFNYEGKKGPEIKGSMSKMIEIIKKG